MSELDLAGVQAEYRHHEKSISPAPSFVLGDRVILKWYDIAPDDAPVPDAIGALARQSLVRAFAAGELEAGGLGFVILHRCGESFYFLLISTWSGNNELWETVWAKDGDGDPTFRPWPREGSHVPTFCVWELGAVWHEQQAWSRFLRSERHATDVQTYLEDSYSGSV